MSAVDISGEDAVHALEVASVGITLLNALSATIVILLVLVDNLRLHRKSWWKLSWERRVPFYLGVSVLFSHIVFATREFIEFGSVNSTANSGTDVCIAANESSWWGIWFPLLALLIRVLLMATSIILKYDAFSTPHECMYVFLVTTISIPLWAPAHILSPGPCSPFILVFSPQSNSSLGIMAIIILSMFLMIICLSLITITWDTCRPAPPQRRSSYLEFDPAGLEGHVPDTSHRQLLAAKQTLISYGLAIFCLYACLLPNFAMIATSRSSEAPIYIASVALHTTGIILLFQYLLMRKTCQHYDRDNSTNLLRPQTSDPNQLPIRLRHSLSTASEEFTRKQRRPFTTYGGGGDYLRRESSGSSRESFRKSVDRTTSGRRIPVRSLNAESRPRTSESRPRTAESRPRTGDRSKDRDMRRSKSFGATEKSPPMPQQDSENPASSPEKEETNENRPGSPKRQPSVGKLRKRTDRIPSTSNELPTRPEEVVNTSQDDTVPQSGEIQESTLRPVLLPPLTNPRRTRSFRRSGSDDSETSTVAQPSAFLRSVPLPLQVQDTSLPTTSSVAPTSSDFIFPFRSDHPSQVADNQNTSQNPIPSEQDLEPRPSWPFQLEDLLEPDPPFASEDRQYTSPTPSESRLSTITEEGTVREVATPPNVVGTDGSSSGRTRNSSTPSIRTATPISPTLASWFSQGGAQYNVSSVVNQGAAASPEGLGDQPGA